MTFIFPIVCVFVSFFQILWKNLPYVKEKVVSQDPK